MANTNIPISFMPIRYEPLLVIRAFCASALASKKNDALILDAAGRAAPYGSGRLYGLQVSAIYDQDDNQTKATGIAAVDDFVDVIIDDDVIFKGQISTFTKTDPVTTAVVTTAYDIAGSAGQQYVDAAASSNDSIRVLGLSTEEKSGIRSEIGAYAKCLFKFVNAKHYTQSVS